MRIANRSQALGDDVKFMITAIYDNSFMNAYGDVIIIGRELPEWPPTQRLAVWAGMNGLVWKRGKRLRRQVLTRHHMDIRLELGASFVRRPARRIVKHRSSSKPEVAEILRRISSKIGGRWKILKNLMTEVDESLTKYRTEAPISHSPEFSKAQSTPTEAKRTSHPAWRRLPCSRSERSATLGW